MKNDCVSIECIYNDLQKKGLCIGVSNNTRSYHKDVIRLCWVDEKPSLKKVCKAHWEGQMTPEEAISIGVGLIRSSLAGDKILFDQLQSKKEGEKSENGKNH